MNPTNKMTPLQPHNPQPTKADDLTGLRCPKCDYELTALSHTQCPECGTAFHPQELRAEQTWDNLRFRRTAKRLLVITSTTVALQLIAFAQFHGSIFTKLTGGPSFISKLADHLVDLCQSLPCFVHPLIGLLSFVVTINAADAQAPRSALIAFIGCIISGVGLILMWLMIPIH